MWDEPEEWRGRGRPDWHPSEGTGTGTRRLIASHRDTGEQQRVTRWMDPEDEEPDRRRELLLPAPAPAGKPAAATWPGPDPLERVALWLDIFKSAVAIVALLVLLFFGGYAIAHGGWPIRFPGG